MAKKKVLTPEELKVKQEKIDTIRACKSLEELQELGRKFGYKDGWSQHAWDFHVNNPDAPKKDVPQKEDIDSIKNT